MARLCDALVDRDALLVWLPPGGMTARLESSLGNLAVHVES